MPDDPRVQQLLDELLDSDATPEAVCSHCVELLPVVRDRWRQMCRAKAELDALFPPVAGADGNLRVPLSDTTALPTIPGYEVEAVLGVGGMGVVFRARHLRLNRAVALKMVLAGAYAGPLERERFQREAEAVAALRHPNVVQIHDISDVDGRPYFTMEYIDGGTLAERMTGTPWFPREAARLIATLAEAIHAAHRTGIIHRDLKPSNIFLTADGTPKIGDFGLARRLNGETGITRTGIALGTPSYMAPEQAGEATGETGPAADVYALGSILYELLTGQPPFCAARADITLFQVLTRDPEPPSRRNAKVPRDLETVCLKCLQKEPLGRYASAAALGDDLERFLQGEAIAARPEGRLSGWIRQVRRRPVFSATVVVAALSTAALIGGGLWVRWDRAAREREVTAERALVKRAADAELAALERVADTDLHELDDAMRTCRWADATAALERARSRLGERGSAALHDRIGQGSRELKLVARWDAIRLDGYMVVANAGRATVNMAQTDRDFEEAFREAGFGEVGGDADVAERIRTSPLRNFLAAELDYWAAVSNRVTARKEWLANLARMVDTDVTGWRRRAVNLDNWKDEASITSMIETAPADYPALLILIKIEQAVTLQGRDPVPFMKRYQQAHTDDLWVNFRLGDALMNQNKPQEAIRYFQAALAIRPRTAILYNNLGAALQSLNRQDEAIEQYLRALEYAPSAGMVRVNLCVLLSQLGRHDEALDHGQIALGCVLRNPVATVGLHSALGKSLKARGRDADALAAFEQALLIDPTHRLSQSGAREILLRQGKREDARVAWEKALEANPPEHNAWYGYAELCLFLGEEQEYRRARTALLDMFGKETNSSIAERTARACLLLPASDAELRQAVALADRAVAVVDRSTFQPLFASFLFAKGLADYREGRFERAVAAMRGHAGRVLGPAPRLVLAMALHRSGQESEARKTLAAAILSHDWRPNQIRDQDGWIFHVLRQEAEGMILPKLPDFLKGTHLPRDNDERLALLGACQFENRTMAAARIYADAFAADPAFANDLRTGHRARAARVAAMAGCGRGSDSAALGELERTKWRAQAREWLRADLAESGKVLERDPTARERVRQTLSQWKTDPDLEGLREPAGLGTVSADEKADIVALWSEVEQVLKRAAEKR
jgi:eukaryotic-like serine/threonine-protein kinase